MNKPRCSFCWKTEEEDNKFIWRIPPGTDDWCARNSLQGAPYHEKCYQDLRRFWTNLVQNGIRFLTQCNKDEEAKVIECIKRLDHKKED